MFDGLTFERKSLVISILDALTGSGGLRNILTIDEIIRYTGIDKNEAQQLIEHLAVLIERKEISFPDIKVLISELSAFQYEISRAGNMKYGAPTGLHDDTVIALALASWGARHQRNPRVLIL